MNSIMQLPITNWKQKILKSNLNDDIKKIFIASIEKINDINQINYLYNLFFQWDEIANTF